MEAFQQEDQKARRSATRCVQLIAEWNMIKSRYTNWQWQPPEVINPDRQRMRGLRAELSANQCAVQ